MLQAAKQADITWAGAIVKLRDDSSGAGVIHALSSIANLLYEAFIADLKLAQNAPAGLAQTIGEQADDLQIRRARHRGQHGGRRCMRRHLSRHV